MFYVSGTELDTGCAKRNGPHFCAEAAFLMSNAWASMGGPGVGLKNETFPRWKREEKHEQSWKAKRAARAQAEMAENIKHGG